MTQVVFFLLSWFGFFFAQPDISIWACLFTSSLGYGLFFLSIWDQQFKFVCCSAFLWFFFAELYHFSWAISDAYVGGWIFIPWIALAGFLSALFVVFVLVFRQLVFNCRPITTIIIGACFWVFLEKIRYFCFFSGLSLDFTGLSLTANPYSTQFISLCGTFGLTFAVITSSLFFYFFCRTFRQKFLIGWLICVLLPYFIGGLYRYKNLVNFEKNLRFVSCVLVQPAIYPDTSESIFLWDHILNLCRRISISPDLIILPEVAIPCGIDAYSCSYNDFSKIIMRHFGGVMMKRSTDQDDVMNRDWLEWLSSYFNCKILVGTESFRQRSDRCFFYNSAILFSKKEGIIASYDKRILVPVGEYVPGGRLGLHIIKKYFPQYFSPYFKTVGENPPIMSSFGLPKFGISICYEETFGHLIRECRLEDAEFLVNLTNDVWYPGSRLPKVHFLHGILRNLELGLPCVRACNTGITGGVDSLGRVVGSLPYEDRLVAASSDVIFISLPLYSYRTPYFFFGDMPLTCVTFSAILLLPILLLSFNPYCQKRGNRIN